MASTHSKSAATIFDWQPYRTVYPHNHIAGELLLAQDVYAPQLDNRRDILLWLPPNYHDTAQRYPVVYMHDGQNLFDAATSFAGDWQVDETMTRLSREGRDAIIVGLNNVGPNRMNEYSPFVDSTHGGGQGDAYLTFIAEVVKPTVDAQFRTAPERAHTGIVGSSMGGLISLYAFFARRDVFGFAGVMSPSLWFADRAIVDYAERAIFYGDGRIYLDAGTDEYADFDQPGARSESYYRGVRALYRLLYNKGYHPNRTIKYVEEQYARHREAAWARRLPDALRFLLPPASSG